MEPIVLVDPVDVAAALAHDALVPPPLDSQVDRPTAALRAGMARFSSGLLHNERRAEVVALIDALDTARAADLATARTIALLDGAPIDAMAAIGSRVPTETLATLLGLAPPFDDIVADVASIVRVIGRGEPVSDDSDRASERLTRRIAGEGHPVVPAASVLYQGYDATRWLIATTLHGRAISQHPAPPVPRTRRRASAPVRIGASDIARGTDVVIEIGTAGLPYGAGPHRCPGSGLAEAIVHGVVRAIDDSGYRVDLSAVTTDDDSRPATLPLIPLR